MKKMLKNKYIYIMAILIAIAVIVWWYILTTGEVPTSDGSNNSDVIERNIDTPTF